jgi:hypothetical protein
MKFPDVRGIQRIGLQSGCSSANKSDTLVSSKPLGTDLTMRRTYLFYCRLAGEYLNGTVGSTKTFSVAR